MYNWKEEKKPYILYGLFVVAVIAVNLILILGE